jgi:hypothetical protein
MAPENNVLPEQAVEDSILPAEVELTITFESKNEAEETDAIIFMTTSSNHYSSARNGDTCCSCTT